MKLAIGTPFYEVKGYSTYIDSLFYSLNLLKEAGVEVSFIKRNGDSYVDRAKNAILAMFRDSDADALLMIDSDMSWDPEGLANIVSAPVDFVGGAYPMKGDWERYSVSVLADQIGFPANHDTETGLLEAVWVAGGFLKLTRRAVERMMKAYEVLSYSDGDLQCVALFQTRVVDRVWQSEDVTFCKRWRALGEKVWVEPRITFGHTGNKEWGGNYHEWLLKQPGGRDFGK